MKYLTFFFVLFIGGIITMVNLGIAKNTFSFIYYLPGGDKVAHFLLMGTLAFLVNSALSCKQFSIFSVPILLGSFLVLIFVTLEEFSQMFLETRTFSLKDLSADYLGIFFLGKLSLLLQRYRRHKTK